MQSFHYSTLSTSKYLTKAFGAVLFRMIVPCHNVQIFNGIIELISVNVVNQLIFQKFSAKMLFHRQSVRKNILTVLTHLVVSVTHSAALPVWMIVKRSCSDKRFRYFKFRSFRVVSKTNGPLIPRSMALLIFCMNHNNIISDNYVNGDAFSRRNLWVG